MELNTVDQGDPHFMTRANASPFFLSSRAPTTSPQPWELHDVDFLLPGPVAGSARTYFQDSSRKHCPSLHEYELGYSPELDDTMRPLTFRSGAYWQDVALSEPATSEFSTYFADDVFSDKLSAVLKSQSSKSSHGTLVPPAQLRVHTTACTFEDLRTGRVASTLLKDEPSVVSPVTVEKKVLVTDSDLRLYSAGNMRALNGRKAAANNSPPLKHHTKRSKVMSPATPSPPSRQALAHRQSIKRRASLEGGIDDHTVRALKRTKSLGQSAWCASALDPRWYRGRPEGFHGMQPRLLSPIHSSTSLGYSGANIYRLVQHQVGVQQPLKQPQYQAPKRKIGIYSPVERRERLKRFHEKRKLRVYHKRIKYDCRKRLANSCPRIKGRFVRKSEFLQAKDSDNSSPTASEAASSTEDCQL
ncbi:hypothetical protein PHYPSEUDO_000880 [Phytophthora pseudosyringae]|uniref:CCT domain-containing protein n=1 Tax=Phytophthora pseudosyringae TaxID=221518 RepID=A0A8T1VXJ8_9STRA|nr:hypothetical protein PHYPSEUDO_000880 [Phytophthora pseudosyringae]